MYRITDFLKVGVILGLLLGTVSSVNIGCWPAMWLFIAALMLTLWLFNYWRKKHPVEVEWYETVSLGQLIWRFFVFLVFVIFSIWLMFPLMASSQWFVSLSALVLFILLALFVLAFLSKFVEDIGICREDRKEAIELEGGKKR